MRGLFLIMGYLLGNETARGKCITVLKQASNVIDKQIKDIVNESWNFSGLIGDNKSSIKPKTDKQHPVNEQDNRGQSSSGTRDID